MTLFRWTVVLTLTIAGSTTPSTAAAPAAGPGGSLVRHASKEAPSSSPRVERPADLEARVELGPAVVYIFDETGRVVSME